MLALLAHPSLARAARRARHRRRAARPRRRRRATPAAVDREPAHVPRVADPGVGAGRARARRAPRRRGDRSQRRAVPRRDAARARCCCARCSPRSSRDPARRPSPRATTRSSRDLELRGQFPVGVFGEAARAVDLRTLAALARRARARSPGAATRIGFGRSSSPGAELEPALELELVPAARTVRLVGQTELLAARRATALLSVIPMIGDRRRRSRAITCAARSITSCSPPPGSRRRPRARAARPRRSQRCAGRPRRRGRRPMRARTSPSSSRELLDAPHGYLLPFDVTRRSALAGEPGRGARHGDPTGGLGYGPIDAPRRPRRCRPSRRDRAAPARPARRADARRSSASDGDERDRRASRGPTSLPPATRPARRRRGLGRHRQDVLPRASRRRSRSSPAPSSARSCSSRSPTRRSPSSGCGSATCSIGCARAEHDAEPRRQPSTPGSDRRRRARSAPARRGDRVRSRADLHDPRVLPPRPRRGCVRRAPPVRPDPGRRRGRVRCRVRRAAARAVRARLAGSRAARRVPRARRHASTSCATLLLACARADAPPRAGYDPEAARGARRRAARVFGTRRARASARRSACAQGQRQALRAAAGSTHIGAAVADWDGTPRGVLALCDAIRKPARPSPARSCSPPGRSCPRRAIARRCCSARSR